MRKFLLLIAVALFTTATYAQLWSTSITPVDEGQSLYSSSTTIDKDGNLYVTGEQTGEVDFAGTKTTPMNGMGSFIVKYNVKGEVSFVITLHGGVMISSTTTDADNNLYVAGMCQGQAIITGVNGFGDDYEVIGSEDEMTAFIAKYDKNGNLLVVKSFKAEHSASMLEYMWDPAMVAIPTLAVVDSKVYALFGFDGDVVLNDDITLKANYVLTDFGWGPWYLASPSGALVSFDSDFKEVSLEACLTVADECADASTILDLKFAVENDDVCLVALCMGDFVLTTSAGSEVFNFQTTNDGTGNVEIGAIVANIGKKTVKVSNKLASVYGENTYLQDVTVKDGKIYLVGFFEGHCAFAPEKVAVGMNDWFVSSIDAKNLNIDWTYIKADENDNGYLNYVMFGGQYIYVAEYNYGEGQCSKYSIAYKDGTIEETEGDGNIYEVAYNDNYVASFEYNMCIYISMYTADSFTSIESVNAEVENNVIYDLTGRRIEKITESGIYIVNGKKVLVK